jgi:hypothetical protein
MIGLGLVGRGPWRFAAAMAFVSITVAALPAARAGQAPGERPMLTARMSRWQGDPAKKRKGPPGFDIQFRLVGSRFDGTFGVEGLPQTVPEGEPFDAQIKLTNIGTKRIKISSVVVTGDGKTLATDLVAKKVEPKSSATVATFKVPAQSPAGGAFLITVVLSNGDKHTATLTFSKVS